MGHYPEGDGQMAQMPHLVRPPAVDWLKVAPYLCAIFTVVSGILGVGMWRMIDQVGDTAKTAAKNELAIKNIETDRAARSATVNARFDKLEQRTGPLEAMLKDIGRLETATGALDVRLTQGREERLGDTGKMVDSINSLKTEVALLRQEQQQLRAAISAEARGRDPAPPFDRNRMLIVPPIAVPAPPIIQKATLSRRSRAVARRGGKGRAIVLASLTRSLERSFGRPHYRGRYWASLGKR